MATVTAIIAFLSTYSSVLLPALTGLVGLVIPSPFQKKAAAEAAIEKSFEEAAKSGRP
jgi:hypothetical protein